MILMHGFTDYRLCYVGELKIVETTTVISLFCCFAHIYVAIFIADNGVFKKFVNYLIVFDNFLLGPMPVPS